MTLTYTRRQRKALEEENKTWPEIPRIVATSEWPASLLTLTNPPFEVRRSRRFLIQFFREPSTEPIRMSVCRTSLSGDRWEENITWDELQLLKSQCGYGDRDACECYPADDAVVNVANMRHLWIFKDHVDFVWRKKVVGEHKE